MVIYAESQPGYAGSPIIVLDGTGVTASGLVLGTGSDGSAIRGFDIINFTAAGTAGIEIDSGSNVVQSNYVGVQADGKSLGQNTDGVLVQGGVQHDRRRDGRGRQRHLGKQERQRRAERRGRGLEYRGRQFDRHRRYRHQSRCRRRKWCGNRPGFRRQSDRRHDHPGEEHPLRKQRPRRQDRYRCRLQRSLGQLHRHRHQRYARRRQRQRRGDSGASGNLIGGSVSGDSNLISGNKGYGISLTGAGTMDTIIAGNLIGTDSSGTIGLPNRYGGVLVSSAPDNTIGGSVSGDSNVISGNDGGYGRYQGYGIYLSGAGTTGTVIAGNNIGTDPSGTIAVPNDGGVLMVDAPDNTVGGTVTGDSNLLSGNYNEGIYLVGNGTSGTTIEGNKVGTDITGTVALSTGNGIVIHNSGSNTIGGTAAGAGNLISGNSGEGVGSYGTGVYLFGASDNLVEGNLIGTDITGTVALPDTGAGVGLFSGSTGNTIGGTTVLARNIIAGSVVDSRQPEIGGYGVEIFIGADGNILEGNFIGTNNTGTAALGTPRSPIVATVCSSWTRQGTRLAARPPERAT